ncbi:MAG: YggS family pyridoxal phosphate-dependent enzyme [Bacteroidota bacterium]
MTADLLDLSERLRARYDAISARISAAATRVGREPGDVTLIAVSKTFPLRSIRAAVAAGLRDFGENRVQELDEKARALPGAFLDACASHASVSDAIVSDAMDDNDAVTSIQSGEAIRWHHIGSLQRNKAKTVCEVADVFHALDSPRLARELDKRAEAVGRVLPCYVQVNVSGEGTKSGLAPEEAPGFIDSLNAYAHIRPVGLMTLASPARAPDELETLVRPQFRRLRCLAEQVGRDRLPCLSMGMSGDFEVAIEEGATHVRVGSALFGARG